MLLNIDRVLQLLSEGKDIAAIEKLSGASAEIIVSLISEARDIIARYEPEKSRRKITLRRRTATDDPTDLLAGAELTAVPVEGALQMYVAVSRRLKGFSAGILLSDTSDKQLGKINYHLNETTDKAALLKTIARACRIALYYRTRSLRIYIDNSMVHRIVSGKDQSPAALEAVAEIESLRSSFGSLRIELITPAANEKARYLSTKRVRRRGEQRGDG